MNSDTFFSFITPAGLYFAASIFGAITILLVALIYFNLYKKKRRFFSNKKITEELNVWISEALVADDGLPLQGAPWLENYMKSAADRQFVADNLINIKKNISGAASINIMRIYEQLELKTDSLAKLNSPVTYKKCRGIYELYVMHQQETAPLLAKYTDSRNESVRMEAQTAVIAFYGFKGLSFLGTQTQPLNDWQQLKLLEQLHTFPPEEMPCLSVWLLSTNDSVKRFALKLADIYQKFEVHEQVSACLSSIDERVRFQAIATLGRIANEQTASILTSHYANETLGNKKNILKQLSLIGSTSELAFLLDKLNESDDNLKLEAGRAITRSCGEGWDVLQEYVAGNDTLLSISRQIKYELAL